MQQVLELVNNSAPPVVQRQPACIVTDSNKQSSNVFARNSVDGMIRREDTCHDAQHPLRSSEGMSAHSNRFSSYLEVPCFELQNFHSRDRCRRDSPINGGAQLLDSLRHTLSSNAEHEQTIIAEANEITPADSASTPQKSVHAAMKSYVESRYEVNHFASS